MRQPKHSPNATTVIFVAALLITSLVSNLHYADALTDEAIEKEARPARAARERPIEFPERLQLSMPIACEDQWISKQLPDGRWRLSCVVADLRRKR